MPAPMIAVRQGVTWIGRVALLTGSCPPSGGFQGGVILATVPMLIYISQNTQVFQRLTSHPLMEFMEAMGAASDALIGILPLAIGVPFLTNILPLGRTGEVFSAGNIAPDQYNRSVAVFFADCTVSAIALVFHQGGVVEFRVHSGWNAAQAGALR